MNFNLEYMTPGMQKLAKTTCLNKKNMIKLPSISRSLTKRVDYVELSAFYSIHKQEHLNKTCNNLIVNKNHVNKLKNNVKTMRNFYKKNYDSSITKKNVVYNNRHDILYSTNTVFNVKVKETMPEQNENTIVNNTINKKSIPVFQFDKTKSQNEQDENKNSNKSPDKMHEDNNTERLMKSVKKTHRYNLLNLSLDYEHKSDHKMLNKFVSEPNTQKHVNIKPINLKEIKFQSNNNEINELKVNSYREKQNEFSKSKLSETQTQLDDLRTQSDKMKSKSKKYLRHSRTTPKINSNNFYQKIFIQGAEMIPRTPTLNSKFDDDMNLYKKVEIVLKKVNNKIPKTNSYTMPYTNRFNCSEYDNDNILSRTESKHSINTDQIKNSAVDLHDNRNYYNNSKKRANSFMKVYDHYPIKVPFIKPKQNLKTKYRNLRKKDSNKYTLESDRSNKVLIETDDVEKNNQINVDLNQHIKIENNEVSDKKQLKDNYAYFKMYMKDSKHAKQLKDFHGIENHYGKGGSAGFGASGLYRIRKRNNNKSMNYGESFMESSMLAVKRY